MENMVQLHLMIRENPLNPQDPCSYYNKIRYKGVQNG